MIIIKNAGRNPKFIEVLGNKLKDYAKHLNSFLKNRQKIINLKFESNIFYVKLINLCRHFHILKY